MKSELASVGITILRWDSRDIPPPPLPQPRKSNVPSQHPALTSAFLSDPYES